MMGNLYRSEYLTEILTSLALPVSILSYFVCLSVCVAQVRELMTNYYFSF